MSSLRKQYRELLLLRAQVALAELEAFVKVPDLLGLKQTGRNAFVGRHATAAKAKPAMQDWLKKNQALGGTLAAMSDETIEEVWNRWRDSL